MLHWIQESTSVGIGQALDPNATDNPALAVSYSSKWGVPTPFSAPQYNGVFWFWLLAPEADWVPQFGAATSLRGAQALEVWNQNKATFWTGPYVRNPPYVFQAGLAPSPGPLPPLPQPVPAPQPQPPLPPAPQPQPLPPAPKPKIATTSSSDFWKPTLTVGAIVAGIVALAWWAT